MRGVRWPAPLRPGDTIGVTAPSSGVPAALLPRLEYAVADLRDRGFAVVSRPRIARPLVSIHHGM